MIRLPFFFAVLAIALASGTAKSIDLYYPLHGVYQIKDGVWTVAQHTETELLLIGEGLAVGDEITFTQSSENCKERADLSTIRITSVDQVEGRVNVTLSETGVFYFCLGDQHQGEFVVLESKNEDKFTIPLPISILLVLVFLVLSALFNGLNIGLLSLSPSELKMVAEAGEGKDQRYADIILPIRRTGNRLLCTILLGCALANSSSAIFLDELVGGGVAGVLGSTMCIVIFGEIVPQSVCSRYPLVVGANTILMTRFFMLLTFPISYPISVILDFLLGEEASVVYRRKHLLHLLMLQDPYNDIESDEMAIIKGALTYKTKTASMIMTKIEDVFMIEIGATLDFKTVSQIVSTGHSRIPVYDQDRDNIVGLLHVKDLAFIDTDDNTPLAAVIKHYNHPIEEVYSTSPLGEMLEFFKQGKTHMAVVLHINNEDPDKDPTREVVGIVTLEDVIEEIIQNEIVDETDRVVDNHTKQAVQREMLYMSSLSPSAFAERFDGSHIADKVALAVFTFLSTSYDAFSPSVIKPIVLKKLIQDSGCIHVFHLEDMSEAERWLYKSGTRSNIFSFVIEGSLKVNTGKEEFDFEAGPYHGLGLSGLLDPHHISDFSAVVSSPKAVVLRIDRSKYLEAIQASQLPAQPAREIITI
eukprot:m.153641 g.153641  ORF g.153641 m.153641 type:complete len:642 (-) comp16240_c4_seq1:79-2004(-)